MNIRIHGIGQKRRPALGRNAGLGLAAAAALVFIGCGNKTASGAPGMPPGGMPVQVQTVQSVTIPDSAEYLSVLKSRHSANINPQVEGQITKIFAKSGDHVKAGQPLLQIDPSKQQATLSGQEASRAAQEATVQLAKISYDRSIKLYEAGVIAKADFDTAQSNYNAAVAQLKSLEEQVNQQKVELHYYTVSAPMDGVVGDVPVRSGDRVTVASLLTTVDEPGALEAYIYVPVDRSRALKVGLAVKLMSESGEMLGTSAINFVSPQVDSDTQTVLAKAAVPNSQAKLRISQQVRAQVTWGQRKGATIPFLNVTRINGQYFAFVTANEGKGMVARQKLVKIGDNVGNDVEVLDGIKPGDHLIVSGTQFLQDGAPVSELPAAPASSPAAGKESGAASH